MPISCFYKRNKCIAYVWELAAKFSTVQSYRNQDHNFRRVFCILTGVNCRLLIFYRKVSDDIAEISSYFSSLKINRKGNLSYFLKE